MDQNRSSVELIISWVCLLICLTFLIVTLIPVLGYVIQIAAIFGFLLFAFRGRFLMLFIGMTGSLTAGIWMLGFSWILMGNWVSVVLPSVLLGRLIGAGVTPLRSMALGAILAGLTALALFYFQKELIYQAIDKFSEAVVMMAGSYKVSQNALATLIDDISRMFIILKRLIPALLILSMVGQLFVGWIFLYVFSSLIGEFFPSLGNYVLWKMPYYYIYLLGIIILLRLIGNENMQIFADNSVLLMGVFYALFGFSAIEYYLKKIRLSLFMRILFYIGFIFLQLPGLIFAALIGLFDSYFDFRKVKARIIG